MITWKHVLALPLALALPLFSACGSPQQSASTTTEAWNAANDPSRFDVRLAKLADLATEGVIPDETYPWSDDYWGTYAGGTSKRWQIYTSSHGNYKDYQYDFLTEAQVQKFIATGSGLPVDVAQLSPSEKYDLLQGRYDFPLTQQERDNTNASVDETGDVPHWFGICHGWAPATLQEPEPGASTVATNPDGIEIPFYTSDLTALMSKVYADYLGGEQFVGSRCNRADNSISHDASGRITASECRDTNPGTLHLTLAQYLGNPDESQRQGFVADVTMSAEVWNQAVTGYKVVSQQVTPFNAATDARAAFRAPGTKYLAKLKTRLSYVAEIAPHATPQKANAASYTRSLSLAYTLELDGNGTIIGGEWDSDVIPDFLWRGTGAPQTDGEYLDYATVRGLVDASRQ
jgi:hypothetical protein